MLMPNGRKQIPSRPGKGGDFSPASADLGVNNDTMQRTQAELDDIKRKKKLMGSQPPLGSAAVAALTGTGY